MGDLHRQAVQRRAAFSAEPLGPSQGSSGMLGRGASGTLGRGASGSGNLTPYTSTPRTSLRGNSSGYLTGVGGSSSMEGGRKLDSRASNVAAKKMDDYSELLKDIFDDEDYLEDEQDDLMQMNQDEGRGPLGFNTVFQRTNRIVAGTLDRIIHSKVSDPEEGANEGGGGESGDDILGMHVGSGRPSEGDLAWHVVHKLTGLETRQSDELMARRAHAELKRVGRWQMFLGTFGMVMCILNNEILWVNDMQHNKATMAVKGAMSISTAALLYMIYSYYVNYVKFLSYKNVLPNPSLLASGMMTAMAVEILINALHVPVGVDKHFIVTMLGRRVAYSADVLQCVVFMRFYLIVRVLRSESQRFGPSARLRGNMCRVPFSTWYVIKAWMLEYPWQVLGAVQLYFLLATAYTVRLWERMGECPAGVDDMDVCLLERTEDFTQYTNSLWLIFATMSTVGYGDLSAATHPGRLASVIAQFGGQALLALVINVFYKKMELDNSERKVFDFTATYNLHRAKRLAAARLIGTAWIFYHFTRKVKEARRLQAQSLAEKKRKLKGEAMGPGRSLFGGGGSTFPGAGPAAGAEAGEGATSPSTRSGANPSLHVVTEEVSEVTEDMSEEAGARAPSSPGARAPSSAEPIPKPGIPVYSFAQRYRMMNMAGMRYNQAKKEWGKIMQREAEIAEVQHDTRSTLDETMVRAQLTDARMRDVHHSVRILEAKLDAVLEALGAQHNVRMPTPIPDEEDEKAEGEQPHEVEVGGKTSRELKEQRVNAIEMMSHRNITTRTKSVSETEGAGFGGFGAGMVARPSRPSEGSPAVGAGWSRTHSGGSVGNAQVVPGGVDGGMPGVSVGNAKVPKGADSGMPGSPIE